MITLATCLINEPKQDEQQPANPTTKSNIEGGSMEYTCSPVAQGHMQLKRCA